MAVLSSDENKGIKIPELRLNRCKCGQAPKLQNHIDNDKGVAIIGCKCKKTLSLEIDTRSQMHIDIGYNSLMNKWNMNTTGGKHVF